jgi:hypothetical protein
MTSTIIRSPTPASGQSVRGPRASAPARPTHGRPYRSPQVTSGACVALDSCRITGRLFFVTMPRRSCGMLSDSRNEWEEAVTAPVRTKRRSPHVRTAVRWSMSIENNKMLVVGNSR